MKILIIFMFCKWINKYSIGNIIIDINNPVPILIDIKFQQFNVIINVNISLINFSSASLRLNEIKHIICIIITINMHK